MAIGGHLANGAHQLDHLRRRHRGRARLHARGEPLAHEADFFGGGVHGAGCGGDARGERERAVMSVGPCAILRLRPYSGNQTVHPIRVNPEQAYESWSGCRARRRCWRRASTCWSGTRKCACRAAAWSTAPSSGRCSPGWCTIGGRTRATRSCWPRVEGSALVSDPESPAAVNVREIRRALRPRAPDAAAAGRGVGARHGAVASQAWAEARQRDDYTLRALARPDLRARAREGRRRRLRRRRATTRCSTTTSRG